MLFSICIPYYCHLDLFKRALASAMSQTDPDFEIIISDDSPLEKSDIVDFVTSFSDPRIRYYKNSPSLGIGGNWNRCLNLAQGEMVSLLHADDELEPNYVAYMKKMGEQYPQASAFFCKTKIINEDNAKIFSFPDFIKTFIIPTNDKIFILQGEEAIMQILKGNFIMCPTLCYRTSFLKKERFSLDLKMVLDLDFIMRILIKGDIIVGSPEQLYKYRRHSKNTTVLLSANLTRFHEEISYYNKMEEITELRQWTRAQKTAQNKTIIKLNLGYSILKSLLAGHYSTAKNMAQLLLTLFKREK